MKILKFYSNSCGPCKVLEKNLQEAGVEYDSINITSSSNEGLVAQYNIRSIPTLVKIDDGGVVIEKKVGVLNAEQIKEFCNDLK